MEIDISKFKDVVPYRGNSNINLKDKGKLKNILSEMPDEEYINPEEKLKLKYGEK